MPADAAETAAGHAHRAGQRGACPGRAAADRVVTGMVSGIGLVGGAAAVALGARAWLAAAADGGVLGCALLLRSRVFHGRAQRLWLQVPGYGGLCWLAVAAGHGKMIAITLVPLAAGAAILIVAGTWLAGHRPSPFWGRAAEIVDMVLVIALVPLALGVAGVFSAFAGCPAEAPCCRPARTCCRRTG